MAVNNFNGGYLPSLGIKYTATTDSFADWSAVPNDTYFYDLQSELPYYKNGAGDVIGIFEPTGTGTLSSVGLTMPSAFNVSNSPLITDGTIAVTGAGLTSQYVRGDGTLADFPNNAGGGGSSQVFYLNGGTSQGTFSGGTYYQLSETPVLSPNVDFSTAVDGVIAQFITDVNQPDEIEIPAGNWIFGTYFSSSSSGGSPEFYIEVLKWNGTTFTSIADSSANPEIITGGTAVDLYFTAVAMPTTSLLATDRIAVRYVVTCDGRTITIHTQQQQLSQVTTTFTKGITALNGLTDNTQYFATGTTGTDFGVSSTGDTHTFNLPVASAVNTGKLSSTDWTAFNNKPSVNIYTGNGTLSGSRQVTMGAFNMVFLGQGTTTGTFRSKLENTTTGKYTEISNDVNQIVLDNVGSTGGYSNTTYLSNLISTEVSSATANSLIEQQDNQISNTINDGAIIRQTNLTSTGFNINGEYTFPNLDGSAGQVITTDGAGTLSWATPTSTNIYNANGTITGNRVVDAGSNILLFRGIDSTITALVRVQTSNGVTIGYSDSSTSVNNGISVTDLVTLSYTDSVETTLLTIGANGYNFNGAYILPKVDGSANQVLTTDGVGNVSWQSGGGISSQYNVTTQAGASYSASANDYVLINASTFILTLPTASANAVVGVKMINSVVTSIQVKTASAGVTIDGVDRSSTGLGIYNQYDAYIFISNGTNWYIMS